MLSAAVRISQPSLSHAIAQLEQELGDPFIQYAHGSGLRHVINDMFAQIDASPNVAYEIQEDPAMTLSPAVADFKRFVLPQSELA